MRSKEGAILLLRLRRAIENGISFGSSIKEVRMNLFDYLDIDRSLINHPDLGSIRIKVVTGRAKHSNITVNMTPKFYEGWSNKKLLLDYGKIDGNGHRFSLMKAVKFQKKGIHLYQNGGIIDLKIKDKKIGYWELSKIIERFRAQSTFLLCIFEKNRKGYNNLKKVNLVSLDTKYIETKFKELVNENHISPEFRMYIGEDHEHCIKRAISPGAVRDHGFGWRLKAKLESSLYEVKILIG